MLSSPVVGRQVCVFRLEPAAYGLRPPACSLLPPASRLDHTSVKHFGDVRMIHQRQRLSLGLEPRHHLVRVHAGLDDLERTLRRMGGACSAR